MKKILFLIHDLGPGGAEKVLVNLVNNMDHTQFDITVMALFGGGVNEQFLSNRVRYRTCFPRAVPGNSHLMKLLSPRQLYRWLIKERYDIAVSYLEGPCARIISGCPEGDTKKVSWIHIEQYTRQRAARSFRSLREAQACYCRFDRTVCVADTVRQDFLSLFSLEKPVDVLYNTVETGKILDASQVPCTEAPQEPGVYKLVGVGKLLPSKGFDRMIRIQRQLLDAGLPTHLYILGTGPQRNALENLAEQLGVADRVTFLGYQTNPYKYMAACDLFLCASHAEGFSTAATEALILGIPVCTVEVSGMKEMLGPGNEWGIVTENSEDALFQGVRQLLEDPALLAHYKEKAAQRGKSFRTEETVRAVEEMLLAL